MDLSFVQATLANGLNVLVHEEPALPLVSVNVWYHVGSKNEAPGRTGFAHLFEHILFEGSAHVPPGTFDRLLESAGGVNNGSTDPDRTNYWETLPSGGLDLALWLESDRMGWLLETMDQAKLDLQREVVKNERRESYENRPYGLAFETLLAELYPPEHPYHWPTIGSMEDLEAATLSDVEAFFRGYYHPGNASLAVAGDVSAAQVLERVEHWFGEIAPGPPAPAVRVPDAGLRGARARMLEDDVQLARLYLAWHGPRAYTQDDAAAEAVASVLAGGRSSRLYRRLVYQEELAQDVSAFQEGGEIGGSFFVLATARPEVGLAPLEAAIREELEALASDGPEPEELSRARNQIHADFVRALERVGGFGGRADRLNEYHFLAGGPGFLEADRARFEALDAGDVAAAARRYLADAPGVALSVVPRGRPELSA